MYAGTYRGFIFVQNLSLKAGKVDRIVFRYRIKIFLRTYGSDKVPRVKPVKASYQKEIILMGVKFNTIGYGE